MELEQTLAIVKPDGVKKNLVGRVLVHAQRRGLRPVAILMQQAPIPPWFWTRFYEEHTGRDYFQGLIDFMSSGPVAFIVLEGENAIAGWREAMGSTNPAHAKRGTIRALWGAGGPANVVHGSDSKGSFLRELTLMQDARTLDA